MSLPYLIQQSFQRIIGSSPIMTLKFNPCKHTAAILSYACNTLCLILGRPPCVCVSAPLAKCNSAKILLDKPVYNIKFLFPKINIFSILESETLFLFPIFNIFSFLGNGKAKQIKSFYYISAKTL